MRKKIILCFFLMLFMLSCIRITGLCDGETGYYHAIEIQIDNYIDPEVKAGTTYWYYFTTPSTTDDEWIVIRVVGHSEKGNIYFEIMDEHLNVVKGSYTTSGDHMTEAVFRLDNTIEGSKETYMPRLLRDKKYYVKVTGIGKYTIGYNRYTDDHPGEFDNATALTAGNEITGYLERDDDIDSYCFHVPTNQSYTVKVYASKKMNARISDQYNYTINTNNLRVLRDRGTAEYTVSGMGTKRYFFLYGTGGTSYKISVTVAKKTQNLGLWTSVTASYGQNFIKVKTYKGAKISIMIKAGKGKGKLSFKNTKKKVKKTVTQTATSKKYYLNRKLKVGDTIIITATKKRYKEFNFKKIIKRTN